VVTATKAEKEEVKLQVRDYLNRGTIDRRSVDTGVGKDGTRGSNNDGKAWVGKQNESY
jgi:hypothetical protein